LFLIVPSFAESDMTTRNAFGGTSFQVGSRAPQKVVSQDRDKLALSPLPFVMQLRTDTLSSDMGPKWIYELVDVHFDFQHV